MLFRAKVFLTYVTVFLLASLMNFWCLSLYIVLNTTQSSLQTTIIKKEKDFSRYIVRGETDFHRKRLRD